MVCREFWIEPRVWHTDEPFAVRLQSFLLVFLPVALIMYVMALRLLRSAMAERRLLQQLEQTVDAVPDIAYPLDFLASEEHGEAKAAIDCCMAEGEASAEAHVQRADGSKRLFQRYSLGCVRRRINPHAC